MLALGQLPGAPNLGELLVNFKELKELVED